MGKEKLLLEAIAPRLARRTLTPRLDCLASLAEEDRKDLSKVVSCLFPRLSAFMRLLTDE